MEPSAPASAAGYRCNKIEAVSCQLTADSFNQPSTLPRRLRFLLRWVFWYNIELVWLAWRFPRKLQDEAALDPIADERRREAHLALAETTAICARVCADCGRCCFEEVDRFTPFDQIVRRNTDIPAPSGNLRIYSLPWMVWNAIAHGFQRLFRLNRHRTPPPCRYLSSEGCSLPREDRPMICVSWFCPRSALAMDRAAMDAAESPLCVIESLHREALRSTKRK